MINIWNKFLILINQLGQKVPKKIQRQIADFPGVLKIFVWLSRGGFSETPTPEGYRLVFNQLFHSNLFRSGTLENYEPEIRKAILKLTRPGMVAYDIGANIGVFSFLFASIVKSGGTVYAFEPEKNNYICLEKSLEINNIKNVFLDKRAVGKYKGKEIFDRRGGAFSGRLIGEDVKYNQTGNIEYIDTINIDTLITVENVLAPDIMKIDVEGNEILVLEGMVNTLQKYSPIILCELHTHLGESSNDVINLLIDNGYSIYGLDEIIKDNYIEPNRMELTRKRYIVGMKQIL